MYNGSHALPVDYVNGVKLCGRCGEEKHFSKFHMTKYKTGTIPRSMCISCRSEYQGEWRDEQDKLMPSNKERIAYRDSMLNIEEMEMG